MHWESSPLNNQSRLGSNPDSYFAKCPLRTPHNPHVIPSDPHVPYTHLSTLVGALFVEKTNMNNIELLVLLNENARCMVLLVKKTFTYCQHACFVANGAPPIIVSSLRRCCAAPPPFVPKRATKVQMVVITTSYNYSLLVHDC